MDRCFVVFRPESALESDRIVSLRRDGVEISGLAPKPVPKSKSSTKPAPSTLTNAGQYSIEVLRSPEFMHFRRRLDVCLRLRCPSLARARLPSTDPGS